MVYVRARNSVQPLGIPLDLAVEQYSHAMKLLGETPLLEAVQYYLKRHPSGLPRKTVSEVVDELIETKRKDGISALYLNDLKKLRTFAEDFQCQIKSVAGSQIDEWLRCLEVSGRTRNNYRNLIQTLVNFAKARKYLPADHDEMSAVSEASADSGEIEIFTPEEIAIYLKAADPHLVPFLAIGAFAGVRHWEIKRLDWQEVRLSQGFVEIKGGKSKTGSRRLVPILPNLKAWLLPYAKQSGPVCTYSNMSEEIMYLTNKLNRKWKHNALRHSFISYRVAQIQNVAQVALEAGNSPQVIFKNYRELVQPIDAERWFSLVPETYANVLPIAEAV